MNRFGLWGCGFQSRMGGTAAVRGQPMGKRTALDHSLSAPVPAGGSPTGTGGLPVLPTECRSCRGASGWEVADAICISGTLVHLAPQHNAEGRAPARLGLILNQAAVRFHD